MANSLIGACATVLVAIIGLIGIIIQAKSHAKLKSQEDLLNIVEQKLDTLKKESKQDDKKLNEKLDRMDMENCKRFLIVEMTKILQGAYEPTEEQRRIIHETHERYNQEGGNSYVNTMFKSLCKKGKL